jgi:drug/metabolite transporter (DMT)-like permease
MLASAAKYITAIHIVASRSAREAPCSPSSRHRFIPADYGTATHDARIPDDFRCALPIGSATDIFTARMRDDRTSYTPHLLLTAVIATWAGSFVVAKLAMEEVTPFALVAARFALGSLCLLPFFLKAPRAQRAATFAPGLLAGLLLAAPYFLQMYGVRETTASMGGFVTGIVVLLVAIGGAVFFRARIGAASIIGVALGLAGILTLCVSGDAPEGEVQENSLRGILLQVGAAIGFAAHILLLSYYGKKLPTAPFAFWQLALTGVAATLATIFVSGVSVDGEPVRWSAALVLQFAYMGVLATGVAIGVQATVQPKIHPTHVALLFALQPLFTALCGWAFLGDQLGANEWAGGGLIVAGVVLAAREQR